MLLSVIIPMYNGEQYIKSCISSILEQDFLEFVFEIIVIDDGSTDNGPSIVKELMNENSNIILYQQSNKGLGLSRNKGLELASGEWIHFVDCDDMIESGSYLKILEQCNNGNYDIFSTFDVISFKTQTFIKNKNVHYQNHSNTIEFEGSFYDYISIYGFRNVVWGYWLRKEFLLEKVLKFDSIAYAEDILFNLSLFHCYDSKICVIDTIVYKYIKRENSAMNSLNTDHLERSIKALADLNVIISSAKKKSKYVKGWFRDFSQPIVSRLLLGKFSLKKRKEIIEYCKLRAVLPSKNHKAVDKIGNILINHPWLMSPMGFTYRILFSMYIKSHIDLYTGRFAFK